MFASSDPSYLPLVVIDISDIRSDRRRRAAPIDEDEVIAPRVSRRSRFIAAARGNIVRLIPGGTRLPFEAGSR